MQFNRTKMNHSPRKVRARSYQKLFPLMLDNAEIVKILILVEIYKNNTNLFLILSSGL
jgi:hypothetical protein